jgi:hypothetical protein
MQEPKPCDKFPKMPLTKAFVAHLTMCEKCRAVLAQFDKDFQSDVASLKRTG